MRAWVVRGEGQPWEVFREEEFAEPSHAAMQRYALDLEECEAGLCCAAAPVHDASGRMVAAVSASGPAFRLGEERLLRHVVPSVSSAAESLSRELGYTAA